jgi:hypothetical protein
LADSAERGHAYCDHFSAKTPAATGLCLRTSRQRTNEEDPVDRVKSKARQPQYDVDKLVCALLSSANWRNETRNDI